MVYCQDTRHLLCFPVHVFPLFIRFWFQMVLLASIVSAAINITCLYLTYTLFLGCTLSIYFSSDHLFLNVDLDQSSEEEYHKLNYHTLKISQQIGPLILNCPTQILRKHKWWSQFFCKKGILIFNGILIFFWNFMFCASIANISLGILVFYFHHHSPSVSVLQHPRILLMKAPKCYTFPGK